MPPKGGIKTGLNPKYLGLRCNAAYLSGECWGARRTFTPPGDHLGCTSKQGPGVAGLLQGPLRALFLTMECSDGRPSRPLLPCRWWQCLAGARDRVL
jgi:hypothetical protein